MRIVLGVIIIVINVGYCRLSPYQCSDCGIKENPLTAVATEIIGRAAVVVFVIV